LNLGYYFIVISILFICFYLLYSREYDLEQKALRTESAEGELATLCDLLCNCSRLFGGDFRTKQPAFPKPSHSNSNLSGSRRFIVVHSLANGDSQVSA